MQVRVFQPWGAASHRVYAGNPIKIVFAICLLGLVAVVPQAWADTAGAATTSAPGGQDFGQYLAAHQDEIGPFFSQNSGEFIAAFVVPLLEWLGRITFASLLIAWTVDVVLSYGFAALFAPNLKKLPRSVIYATGRLIIGLAVPIALGIAIIFVAGAGQVGLILFGVMALFALIGIALQVVWIRYTYRTDLVISLLFYLTLLVMHGFVGLAITLPAISAHVGDPTIAFIDNTITPKLKSETDAARQQLAQVTPDRDRAAAAVAEVQDEIDQAKSEQAEVAKQIDEARNSEVYLFSQIVKVHARGDLASAREQFTEFLNRFPNGAMTGLAKGQLVQIDSELAEQEADRKTAAEQAQREAQQAKADLLARAGKGEVTLSEMRRVLIGKSRAEVSALFGPPTETASDRWGFAQRMIVNPLTNEKSGLAVYFNDGAVQSVDYYYGAQTGGPGGTGGGVQ